MSRGRLNLHSMQPRAIYLMTGGTGVRSQKKREHTGTEGRRLTYMVHV